MFLKYLCRASDLSAITGTRGGEREVSVALDRDNVINQ